MDGKRRTFLIGAASASTALAVPPLAFARGGKSLLEGGFQGQARSSAGRAAEAAALQTYVAPGSLDKYYLFVAAGHSGNVIVYGVPSMRPLVTIPVFTPAPAMGYGFDSETKAMLGRFHWGDLHHPALSETNGDYDGRWLFVADEGNNRMARIDLRDFKTKQILGPIPNVVGNHCSSFATENTEYLLAASRFSIPLPKGTYAPIEEYATTYKGVAAGIAVDRQSGEMSLEWQVLLPPFQYDYGDAGKGPSREWSFWPCYNSERATGKLEDTTAVNPFDYVVAVNWKVAERAISDGKFKLIGGARVINPKDVPGVAFLMPAAKSPHGTLVTPDGRYVVVPGKLAPIVTIFSVEKMLAAIQRKDFTGNEDGIPVLNYRAVMEAEIEVGLGALHTQFDNEGYAYTSLYDAGEIVKWQLGTWKVTDRLAVKYNVGHLAMPSGDAAHPTGKYLVSLNKTEREKFRGTQHLSVGPAEPKSLQLIDVSGAKLQLLSDTFADPEPHYAQFIKASLIKPIKVYPRSENKNPHAIWDPKDARIVRDGTKVSVSMTAIMSSFTPNTVEVNQGDHVTFYITNIETEPDETHGFALSEADVSVSIDPGRTAVVEFAADKPGVFPFYCTVFCSSHHEEMQGYLLVKPASPA